MRVIYKNTQERKSSDHGWATDFPDADINLSMRLPELTHIATPTDSKGNPLHTIVDLQDKRFFNYPFIYMSDVGRWNLQEAEIANLREYLDRGGFLWVDEFWSDYNWNNFMQNIRRVLPRADYPLNEIPLEHPIYRTHFDLEGKIPKIPSFNYWLRTKKVDEWTTNDTPPYFGGIFDTQGRLVVVITYNTDIADGWEKESQNKDFFDLFSNDAYAVATNIILYAITH